MQSRILLVDDRRENLIAIESVLAPLGQELIFATSGEAALRELLLGDFACILLDVQMPGMDGFEAARLIRSRPKSRTTPILFLTAISKSDSHVTRGYELGAVDYLFKPYDPAALRAKVLAFVELDQRSRELQREVEQRIEAERDLRSAQDELRKLNSELERRVEARTMQLEAARKRLALLAEAGAVVMQSLDYHSTFVRLSQLICHDFCDTCLLAVLDSDGSLRRVAHASRDTEIRARLRGGGDVIDLRLGGASPASRALMEGKTVVASTAELARMVESGEQVLIDDSAIAWLAATPLVVRGRTYGVLLLARHTGGARFTAAELDVGEELARRAAAAIDNARLLSEVQDAARKKDEFLAMLGHELRNPLASSSYALHSLGSCLQPGERPAKLHELIRRQTSHLAHLVDDLLDVSRITRGKIELQKQHLDLRQILHRAIETVQPLISERKHRLERRGSTGPIHVLGDPVRLEQVMVNLLTNAAKYTDPEGRISLEVRRRVKDSGGPGSVEVRVSDTGCGIEPERLPTVFDLFTQLEPGLDRQRGGLGIGLFVARQIINLHGGGLTAESEGAGKGSTFTVALPLEAGAIADAPALPASGPVQPCRRNLSVLLVEDNRDAAETLVEILEEWGHAVHWSGNGYAALDWLSENPADLVILDIGLPEMSGYELAVRIRERPEYAALPLVALSGYGREDDQRQSEASGVTVHLTKPVDLGRFREIIDGLVAAAPAGCLNSAPL